MTLPSSGERGFAIGFGTKTETRAGDYRWNHTNMVKLLRCGPRQQLRAFGSLDLLVSAQHAGRALDDHAPPFGKLTLVTSRPSATLDSRLQLSLSGRMVIGSPAEVMVPKVTTLLGRRGAPMRTAVWQGGDQWRVQCPLPRGQVWQRHPANRVGRRGPAIRL
ncbi:MAG: hypothetical protein QOI25_3610 [Mycobacterium sp.]|nr:hypothetical protein [Mycobacterium sp.]